MSEKNSGYPEFSSLHLPSIEKSILPFWKKENVFAQSVSNRPEENPFVFYEGPPSANGLPGIHHVLSRTIKDLFCRYKTLRGYRVERRAGWDTHGLPVEINVEKTLGITKADIGTKISVEEYNRLCREDVMRFTDKWNELTEKMGYWVDLDNPYITYETPYIETLWQVLKRLYDKGLLYEGFTIQPYSPAIGTGLSSHELNQPGCYRQVRDVSAVAMFCLQQNDQSAFLFAGDSQPIHCLAWTTTPWTLPSNTALAVGSDISYVLVKTYNAYTFQPQRVILAKDRLSAYFPEECASLSLTDYQPGDKQIPYFIEQTFSGSVIAGLSYEQLLPYVKPEGKAFLILSADFVTTTDGTGIVHIAPSFGSDDFKVARQNGIAALTLVDRQGRLLEEVQDDQFPLAGRYVKEAYLSPAEKETELQHQQQVLKPIIPQLDKYLSVDELIVLKLKRGGQLFRTEKYEHSYPHCWRTDKPIIYYPLDSWFIRTTAYKDRLIALNKTINWKPAHTGEGRFGQWLENLVDWNLSRSRYWGTPLPIWKTEDGTEEICIGSVAELQQEIARAVAAGLMKPVSVTDLHKPVVDDILLVSPSGKPMRRVSDLIDVWFDSGAMPYAQIHWPFEQAEAFTHWQGADFIAEGVDQTRGWFFTLHVLAVMIFDTVAYRNVVSNGLLLDKHGNKMSKRLGNVVEPFATLEKYSADATRWYMMRNSDPWENLKFDESGIEEVISGFFGTLYNTYSFFALYANIDGYVFRPESTIPVAERTELERWILSKLHSLREEVTRHYDEYEPTRAARAIEEFTDEHLSNWYVRLSRRVFWKSEMSREKQAAYETLYECLLTVSQLMSPVAPFFSEWLYRNLQTDSAKQKLLSVHLSDWKPADKTVIDQALEARMELAQRVCSLALSLRKKEKIKVRQPLSRILIPILHPEMKQHLEKVSAYILSEINVKEIQFVDDTAGMIRKKLKPNFKALGARAGSRMKVIQQQIALLDTQAIGQLERDGQINLDIPDGSFVLLRTEVEVVTEDIPGWLLASDGPVTVALDVHITEELRLEGQAREMVNKIQNLRKDKGFNVLDRIAITYAPHPMVEETVSRFREYICREVLAEEIRDVSVSASQPMDSIEVNEHIVSISLTVIG